MNCCPQCFSSQFLKEHIDLKSTHEGTCDFCGSTTTKLLPASEMADLMQPVADLYTIQEEGGESLATLIHNDWKIFASTDNNQQAAILSAILSDDPYNHLLFTNPNKSAYENCSKWDNFKAELKHENRFFPTLFPESKTLSLLISALSIQSGEELTTLYRARHNHGSEPLPITQMGAPPKDLASAGRANPFGISYLYTASTVKTAVSEIRPHVGDQLTIASFTLTERLKLIDLRTPRLTAAPFRFDEEEIRRIHSGIELLARLSAELTQPISQKKAQLEYLSTQYLCEFIKSEGYHGVIYKSALGDGDNYAIYDAALLKPMKTQQVLISAIDIAYQDLPPSTEQKPPQTSTPNDQHRLEGKVKWFDTEKRYGVITNVDNDEYFVHFSEISSKNKAKTLTKNQLVTFIAGNRCGRDVAKDVLNR